MKQNRHIWGIETLLECLPEEYQHWELFGNIEEFFFVWEFDYLEQLKEIPCIRMILTDQDKQYRIRLHLHDVHGDVHFNVHNGFWSGLTIQDHVSDGWETDHSLVVTSFEQDSDVEIHCRRIAVELVE